MDYASRAECASELSHVEFLGKYKPVSARRTSPDVVLVTINDAEISDSGNDVVEVQRYARGWLLNDS